MRNYNYRFIKADPDFQSNLMGFGYDCGPGWDKIISDLFDKLDKIVDDDFEILQVKEKFGYLNVYTNYGTDEIFKLIDDAMNKSATVCENCGEPGSIRLRNGWYSALCDKCFSK